MRENWDFVTMENYRSDMAELGQIHRAVVETLRCEIINLRSSLWASIHAAGGRVEITNHTLRSVGPHCEIVTSEDVEHGLTVLQARTTPTGAAP